VDEQSAKQALRILVDFLKSQSEEDTSSSGDIEKAMKYEPLLSHLISLKSKYLM
jgi:hypothetical protein